MTILTHSRSKRRKQSSNNSSPNRKEYQRVRMAEEKEATPSTEQDIENPNSDQDMLVDNTEVAGRHERRMSYLSKGEVRT